MNIIISELHSLARNTKVIESRKFESKSLTNNFHWLPFNYCLLSVQTIRYNCRNICVFFLNISSHWLNIGNPSITLRKKNGESVNIKSKYFDQTSNEWTNYSLLCSYAMHMHRQLPYVLFILCLFINQSIHAWSLLDDKSPYGCLSANSITE